VRRAALALAVLLSGSRTMAEPCAPSARVDGDDDLAAGVGEQLRLLGIATSAGAGCPILRVVVARDGSGAVTVTVRDARDRIEGRVVGGVVLAALWIDSWLRDDVAAPLLAAHDLPVASDLPRPAPAASPVSTVAASATAARSLFDRAALDAGYETGWGDDGSSWSGASAMACVQVRRVCVGARGRGAWQPTLAPSDGSLMAHREDLEALAIATLSFELGRMRVAPELGAGVGHFSTDGCRRPPKCNPGDPATGGCKEPTPPPCTDPNLQPIGPAFHTDTWTPRLAASVRVSVPLFEHVWLEGVASGHVAPGSKGELAGEADASGYMPVTPGEPGAWLTLGVGLRVGAP
jgi:hypothetical protein